MEAGAGGEKKKKGKKTSATGALPRAAMIQLSVSSCHSRPKQLWKHRKDQEEAEGRAPEPDFSLLMRNIL